jgi:hypothetical protein
LIFGPQKGKHLSANRQAYEGALKQARLAVAAHLDALSGVDDAKALRLDYLRDLLFKQLPADSEMRRSMVLRLPPEGEARLLLDARHAVVMAADGRGYRLEADVESRRQVLFEATSVDDMAHDILRRVAVAEVESANRETGSAPKDTWAQAALFFAVGVLFGATALAALAIYLKKLVI